MYLHLVRLDDRLARLAPRHRGYLLAVTQATARPARVHALVVEGQRLVSWGVAGFLGWGLAIAAGVGCWLALDRALAWLR